MRKSDRTFPINFEFRFSFFAVLGFMVCTDRDGAMVLCALACLLHELGHLTVMLILRKPPSSIVFYGGGIHIRGGSTAFPAVIAGCAVNAALFLMFGAVPWENERLRLFGAINLLTGAFNFLPVSELDGKILLELLFARFFRSINAVRYAEMCEHIAVVLAFPLTILLVITGYMNFSAIIFFFYILMVEILEKI